MPSSPGVNFDFFGIGEFWGCKSVKNDFGLQFRFYYYERASLIGGIALKAGRSVVTIMTIKTERVQDLPITRFGFCFLINKQSISMIEAVARVTGIFKLLICSSKTYCDVDSLTRIKRCNSPWLNQCRSRTCYDWPWFLNRIDGVEMNATSNLSEPIEISNGTVLLDHQRRFSFEAEENSVVLISLQYDAGKS